MVGDVEVYKVHHHGSRYSTNDNWFAATTPEVGIIQVGDGNSYGHPIAEALARLHAHAVKTYWTETGAGVAPDPQWDKVGGNIVVQADPGNGAAYTVAGTGFTDTYYTGGGTPPPPPIHATEVAEGVTVLKGSITAGDYTRLAAITLSRVYIAQKKPDETIRLLTRLEESAESGERTGRLIEILLLEALAMQEIGDSECAILALTKCLTLAEPEGYMRVFLDEGEPMLKLLKSLRRSKLTPPLKEYVNRLLEASTST